jgi:hypothetical protein
MGYTTEFDGALKFKHPLSVEQDSLLRTILTGDMELAGDHPEWIKPKGYNGYVQLVITKDGSGIEWDGNEKFYDAVDAVNTVIMTMQAKFPEFGLTGELTAQGEDIKDRWLLAIGEDGFAYEKSIDLGAIYKCPHCREEIILSQAEKIL